MAFRVEGDRVQGVLSYRWKDKDQSSGRIEGTIKDSVLLADYNFSSEGRENIRQVSFELSKGRAVEGYGAVEEKSGKVVFVSPDQLKFDETFVLTNVRTAHK